MRNALRKYGLSAITFCVFVLLLLGAGSMRHASSLNDLWGRSAASTSSSSSASSSASITAPVLAAPKRLIIPALEIDAPLEEVGINQSGETAVPKDAAIPGWYKGGVKPGEQGNAVIAGHRDAWGGTPGVFFSLKKLKIGELITVEDGNGTIHRFKVIDIREYKTDLAPVQEIFGKSDKPRLQLITCSGTWSGARRSYEMRTVIYTELVS
jgi:sortase A